MRASPLVIASVGLLLAVFTLWWAGSGTGLADFGGDNAVYFLTANHYSPFGTAHAAAAEFAAQSIYPPLYPWVLALTGGGTSLAAAHRVTAGIILLAGLAVFMVARALGLSRALALAIVAVSALARITLLEGLEIHSEHLYLALWMTAVALLVGRELRPPALYAAALAIGAAYLTRSFGITLVASFVVWLALTRPPKALHAVLLVMLPAVLLTLGHHGNARYLHEFARLYGELGVGARLDANLAAVWPAWQGVFGERGQPGYLPALPAALAVLGALGLATRLRVGGFDAWSACAYLALMILWPYPAEYERMSYPLLPLTLIYAVLGARALLPRIDPALSGTVPLVLALAAIAPFAALVQARLMTPPADAGLHAYLRSSAWFDPDPAAAFPTLGYQRGIAEALRDIGQSTQLPRKACLLATKPSVAALLSGLRAEGYPPFALDTEALRDTLARGRCHYLFMMMGASPSFPQYYYPYARLKPWLEVLKVYPNTLMPGQPVAMLARLRANESKK